MKNGKSIFVISTHSFVDLITNSSSELFICDTKKTIEGVVEIIKILLEQENKINGTTRQFKDCFHYPTINEFDFSYYNIPKELHDEYRYYNKYSTFEPNRYDRIYDSDDVKPGTEEREMLEEKCRIVSKKLITPEIKSILEMKYDKIIPSQEKKMQKHHQECDDARNDIWSEYGAKSVLVNGKMFDEFLRQNKFSNSERELVTDEFSKTAEKHRKEKRGEWADYCDNTKFPKNLRKAYDAYRHFADWGITASKGAIMLNSIDDNSVPYDMFGAIESYLHATRYHLG